jgi:hypothetical protein
VPKLSEHKAISRIKGLLVADSGLGKTGSLAALVRAGYSLKILDYDNGCHILTGLLTPEEQDRVYVETLQDPIRPTAKGPRYISDPVAFATGLALLDHWKTGDYDLGRLKDWTTDSVLVIDSFTMFNAAAMRYVQCFQAPQGQSRLGDHPSQRDYGLAMEQVERCLELLFNDKIIPCHLLINCHIKWMTEPGEKRTFEKHGQGEIETTPIKCYPMALGRQLPPKVGTYFNTIMTMEAVNDKRYILPKGDTLLPGKIPHFNKFERRIEVKGATGGLATVFETLLGTPGPGNAS